MSDLRPNRWTSAALLLAVTALLAATSPPARPPQVIDRLSLAVQVADVAGWPVSADLLVSEVVTGAASASDEFVEIYNAATSTRDLGGLELVYFTASGSTVTRKQTWTQLPVGPGQHVLIANSVGKWAAAADGLYTGGFAATGGTLVLRSLEGQVIDSLSWGEATNAFVEGAPAPAPPAGTSLERRPGGELGNGHDTNDNLADTRLEPNPVPQSLASPPAPAPTPSIAPTPPAPTPTVPPTVAPTPDPTLEPTIDPTAEPTPDPTPEPTIETTPGPTPDPTPEPTAEPTPDPTPNHTPEPTTEPTVAPTPDATPEPTPDPTPEATAGPTAVPSTSPSASPTPEATPTPPPTLAEIRALPLGTAVVARARLTTPTGLTETGRGAFMEDPTAGIALYLPSADWPALPAGTDVRVSGVLETRFSLLTLRLAGPADLVVEGSGPLAEPLPALAGTVSEEIEGRLVALQGVINDGISTLTDGFSTQLDDGTGQLRVVVAQATGIPPEELRRGRMVMLVGVIGQRDTSGTGMAGYRLHLRSLADVISLQPPSTPTPTPTATPSPSPTPTTAPTATPGPTASPSPTGDPPVTIAIARQRAIGQRVTVRGVVTVSPGRILGDVTIAIQDASAGICVRLAAADPLIAVGRTIEVDGILAAPFGNLEVRPAATGVRVLDNGVPPEPKTLNASQLGEATEGLLARLSVRIKRIDASSTGSLTLIVEDASGEGRVFSHAPLGLVRADFSTGQQLTVTGIIGDRQSLYRLWPRNRSDITITGGPPTGGGGSGGGSGGTPGPAPSTGTSPSSVVSIADALRRIGQKVTVQGTVTVRTGLLDADGRRVTIQDGTAGVLVRLPVGASVAVGQRLRVSGEMGTYYGAPQLAASDKPVVLDRAVVTPLSVRSAPLAAGSEWRLVTVSGTVESVRRDGEAWRAELALPGGKVPVTGLARSAIPSTALVAGRAATVTGIVRRAFSTASDQRLVIVPRAASDIVLGSASGAGSSPGSSGVPGTDAGEPGAPADPAGGGAGSGGDEHAGSPNPAATPVDVALSGLAAYVGLDVRVGGRVERRDGARLVIADDSATAVIRLSGRARALAPLFGAGELINVQGQVERNANGGLEVRVDDPGHVQRVAPGASARPSASAPVEQLVASGEEVDVTPGTRTASADNFAIWLALLATFVALSGMAVSRRKELAARLRRVVESASARFRARRPI